MTIAMLWFDNSPTPLSTKIEKAVAYYVKKHGKQPNFCLVHPKVFDGKMVNEQGVTIRPYRSVLPGHIWIGLEEEKENK